MRSNAGANADDTSMSRRGFFRASAGAAAATAAVAAGSGTAAAAYDGYLDDVPNYEGTYDYRDEDEIHVEVGAGDDGLLFEPAAILVDEGATVVWEWTGEGGQHNVAAEDESFESDLVDEAGHTFEHTFDDAEEGDFFNYLCTPHEAVGMKGTVAVGDTEDEIIDLDGDENGEEGNGDDEEDGVGRQLTSGDIGALALAFGFAGALLVPLFYAAHKKSQHD